MRCAGRTAWSAASPPAAGPGGRRCSCPASTICRHLVRSVLAYQRLRPPETETWDPGTITDAALEGALQRATLNAARRAFAEGQVLELTRGRKPAAYLHTSPAPSSSSSRTTSATPTATALRRSPRRHVPLAVWAFRLLPEGDSGGVVSTGGAGAVPAPLLDDVEGALEELFQAGVAETPAVFRDRLAVLEGRSREGGLIWPAEILADLVAQCEAYAGHDARFSPPLVAGLVGELCVRLDAIRADTGAVPPLFVRGGRRPPHHRRRRPHDRVGLPGPAPQGRRRDRRPAAGVGLGARAGRAPGLPRPPCRRWRAPHPFWRLAQVPLMGGASLAALGSGQLLARGGRRTPGGEYLPGRAQVAHSPQTFAWERLRAPTLGGPFAEVSARLAALPPPALRPRRVGDDLCALPVAAVEGAHFESASQTVQATLRDAEGGGALLRHPYLARAREGAEALLGLLTAHPDAIRYVSGRVQRRAESLLVTPVAVVFEAQGRRRMLQPWVEGAEGAPAAIPGAPPGGHLPASSETVHGPQAGPGQEADPLAGHLAELEAGLGELLLLGLRQAGAGEARAWRTLQRRTVALGLPRLGETLDLLAGALEGRARDLRWEPSPAIEAALTLAALLQIAGIELSAVPGPA